MPFFMKDFIILENHLQYTICYTTGRKHFQSSLFFKYFLVTLKKHLIFWQNTFKLLIILMFSTSCEKNKPNTTLKTLFGEHNMLLSCEKHGFEKKQL